MPEQDARHVPISELWEFSRDPRALEAVHIQHLLFCETCMGILWICRASDSSQQVNDRLSVYGSNGP